MMFKPAETDPEVVTDEETSTGAIIICLVVFCMTFFAGFGFGFVVGRTG